MFSFGIRTLLSRNPYAALRVIALSALLLLQGCQTLPQRQPLTPEQQHQYLPLLKHWDAQGKIALSYGSEQTRAQLQWQQRNEHYRIILSGPLGIGLTKLTKNAKGVTLENNELGVQQADTPELLMQALLGWQVPVSNLQYWMLGRAAPKAKVTRMEVDEQGWTALIEQDGWQIHYSKPIAHNGWTLPRKIVAQHGEIKIIAITKTWKTHRAPRI